MRTLLVLLVCLAALACGADPAGSGAGGSGGSSAGGGSGGEGPGALDCAGVFICVSRCDDAACIGACQDAADPDAWDAAYALSKCALDHGCSTADCPQCAEQRDACVHRGISKLSCASLYDCVHACGGDPGCVQDFCMNRTKPGAAEAYAAYQNCVTQYGCADDTCIQLNCGQQQDDCFGG